MNNASFDPNCNKSSNEWHEMYNRTVQKSEDDRNVQQNGTTKIGK